MSDTKFYLTCLGIGAVAVFALFSLIFWLESVPQGKYKIISLKRVEVQEGKYRFKRCLIELKDEYGKIEEYKKPEEFCLQHNLDELLEVK